MTLVKDTSKANLLASLGGSADSKTGGEDRESHI